MVSKIIRFFYRVLSKIVYLLIPIFSKIFITFKLNSRIINQLVKLRSSSNDVYNHKKFISKLLLNEKLIALDVGAQGGFFEENIFPKKYNDFFSPILVEPLENEAKKLTRLGHKVITKGLWSKSCKKNLYILKQRLGSSSMYKPNKAVLELHNLKKKDSLLFDATKVVEIECSTLDESLKNINVENLDFLKIDTQGAELEILKGLGKYYPLMIKAEAQIIPMYENVPHWSELINYLSKLNYMTCEWTEIGPHSTKSPAEMDMLFVPNYLNNIGKQKILSKEKEFISLMLIFGQIKLLQIISKKLNFSTDLEIQKLKDKFFY